MGPPTHNSLEWVAVSRQSLSIGDRSNRRAICVCKDKRYYCSVLDISTTDDENVVDDLCVE
jgi:hypothetical protein